MAFKYPKGVVCLTKDKEAMLAFFDFPAEHWGHLRTSNPIESVFATVRHRTVRTKGALSQKTAKLMVFTLIQAASKKWLRLKGRNQLPKVIEGIKFNDGVEVTDDTENRAACASPKFKHSSARLLINSSFYREVPMTGPRKSRREPEIYNRPLGRPAALSRAGRHSFKIAAALTSRAPSRRKHHCSSVCGTCS